MKAGAGSAAASSTTRLRPTEPLRYRSYYRGVRAGIRGWRASGTAGEGGRPRSPGWAGGTILCRPAVSTDIARHGVRLRAGPQAPLPCPRRRPRRPPPRRPDRGRAAARGVSDRRFRPAARVRPVAARLRGPGLPLRHAARLALVPRRPALRAYG